ncbi:hypothetical protein [Solimonas soli]|uniref:hypothetical protein n=1 Tax=Solimonas soli TaxID=413479 RepID=UPI0004B7C73B|nr:hypothetical protein [Solimonas soli]
MNTRISIIALAIAVGVSAVALADEAASEARIQATATATAKSNCLQETGSRIRRGKDDCVPAPGQSFSQEDLRRTGAAGTAAALRQLSPALR